MSKKASTLEVHRRALDQIASVQDDHAFKTWMKTWPGEAIALRAAKLLLDQGYRVPGLARRIG